MPFFIDGNAVQSPADIVSTGDFITAISKVNGQINITTKSPGRPFNKMPRVFVDKFDSPKKGYGLDKNNLFDKRMVSTKNLHSFGNDELLKYSFVKKIQIKGYEREF